ncbi:hypothetical protein [Mesobacillus sp.]|uniref:hypothetical protein n=1 Tax=Mesobacillus sp. TaxID=2675271 RepID=UPI0039EF6829
MIIPGKIASITLSTILGVSGLGVASAALSPDSQQEGIKNQTQIVSTDISNPSETKTMQVNAKTVVNTVKEISPEQMQKLHDNWLVAADYGLKKKTVDIYEKMIQKDRQSMENVTREKMEELDRGWMKQTNSLHQKWERIAKNSSTVDYRDRYEKMIDLDQQMMEGIRPEHFMQLDAAWMKQLKPQHQMAPSSSKQAATVSNTSKNIDKQAASVSSPAKSIEKQAVPFSNSQKNTEKQAAANHYSSMSKEESNHNTEDSSVHSSHDKTNSNHSQTETNHQVNMNENHQANQKHQYKGPNYEDQQNCGHN